LEVRAMNIRLGIVQVPSSLSLVALPQVREVV
jgi:hypothetical protein